MMTRNVPRRGRRRPLRYEEAVKKYTDAATAFSRSGFQLGVGVCLTNRAIVAAKLGWWAESYCDAKLATKAFPKFAKAWFRAAMALENLGMLRTAGALSGGRRANPKRRPPPDRRSGDESRRRRGCGSSEGTTSRRGHVCCSRGEINRECRLG